MRARAPFLFVAALMAAYVTGYAYSASIQDTARDVFYAYAIRHGIYFPLEGPILGGALHLGPVWFYTLALPLFAQESWLAAALFAGFLASLKFPLAYACGSRLLDRDLGLFWAACLAAPGWPTFESLIFFNPNPAAAAVLLALLLALRVGARAPRPWESLAFGLTCALGLHIHPTTAPVAILGLAFLAAARYGGGWPGRTFALMAVGFAIPFMPYLVSQAAGGFRDTVGIASYLDGQMRVSNLLGLPAVLVSQLGLGPAVVAQRIDGLAAPLAFALAGLFALPVVFAACGYRRGAGTDFRATAAGLALSAILFAAWIALLRPTTPVYFMYALAPLTAGLAALGLWWLRGSRLGRVAAIALCALIVGGGIAAGVRMASIVRHGEGVLTSQVLDVKRWSPTATYADTWFPASGRSALGRFLCARPEGIAIHGHLAFLVDRAVGVDALLSCHRADHVRLGGNDPGIRHWVGLSRTFWSRLDARGACRLGSLELAEASPVATGAGLAIPDGRKYYPRQHATSAQTRSTVEFDAPPGNAVLVTNILHGYQPFAVVETRANGESVPTTAANDLSALFAAPPAVEGVIHWVVSFDATLREGVDIVTFPRAPAPVPTPECP